MRVLRLRDGDLLELLDGAGTVQLCRLLKALPGKRGDQGALQPIQKLHQPAPALKLCLLQGLSTAEHMDFSVQKGVELGLDSFVAVQCERSTGQLDRVRAARKVLHWHAVAASACQQSGNPWLASIEGPLPWADALTWLPPGLRAWSQPVCRWVLDPYASLPLARILEQAPPWASRAKDTPEQAEREQADQAEWAEQAERADPGPPPPILILVGPEAGLSPSEAGQAEQAGFIPVHLGPRTLRTETAALAALGAIQSAWGDWSTTRQGFRTAD